MPRGGKECDLRQDDDQELHDRRSLQDRGEGQAHKLRSHGSRHRQVGLKPPGVNIMQIFVFLSFYGSIFLFFHWFLS